MNGDAPECDLGPGVRAERPHEAVDELSGKKAVRGVSADGARGAGRAHVRK